MPTRDKEEEERLEEGRDKVPKAPPRLHATGAGPLARRTLHY